MKLLVNTCTLLMAWWCAGCIAPQPATAQPVSVTFQVFYNAMSPYGMWVEDPTYGYVWIPKADPGFSPYVTAGHWILANDSWTWDSDYPWGWAPFHYGRWECDSVYGWLWVPESEWGPAWVTWRRSPGYYGWSAIAPGKVRRDRMERWTFVKVKDFAKPDISRYAVNRSNNEKILEHSTLIRNSRRDNKRRVTYPTGPVRDDVQRAMPVPIAAVAIRDDDRPGSRLGNGELWLYRPHVQQRNDNGHSPVPGNVVSANDARMMIERNSEVRERPGQLSDAASPAHPSESPTAHPLRVIVTERRIWIGDAPISSPIQRSERARRPEESKKKSP